MRRMVVTMMMLDQNLVVLHNVLLPTKWNMAKLVLGVDLANSVTAFHLGSNYIKRLAVRCMSSFYRILRHMSIVSSFPREV